jgi:two-component system, cell cycle sensor histidine kinase and response regulator CckA
VTDARDAMPRGGELSIETDNVDLEPGSVGIPPDLGPGRYVMLAMRDTGHGMDPTTKARILEPFFTTKEVGKGTGLGLAVVYGIVKQSGGGVYVYSEPGRGTTFKIYWPRVDELSVQNLGSGRTKTAHGGTETIVLVEDSGDLRKLAGIALKKLDYTILEAEDGSQALRLAEEYPGDIHLVLSDIVMPGLNGREAAAELVKRRPDIKVLLMSGYTDDALVYHGVAEDGIAFLSSPSPPRF